MKMEHLWATSRKAKAAFKNSNKKVGSKIPRVAQRRAIRKSV